MVRRVLWLGLMCACTNDFSTFDPDASTPPNDGAADQGTVEAGQDAQPPVEAGKDVTAQDAPADVVVDVKPDAPVTCTETGAITYNNHCYYLVTTAQTQTAAGTGCTNAGAHLVTITTAGEQAAVIALGTGTERWTDLVHNGVPVKDSNYSWANGESRNGFSAWSPGEPNGTGQCATLLATGLWNDQDCSLTLSSICERE